MIKESFQFLAEELQKYLKSKGITADAPTVVLGNVARAYDSESPPSGADPITNRAIFTLVNVEEDKISKQQENYIRADIAAKYKSPPLFLNLYLLVSVNRNNYSQSLTWLARIMQFFQFQHVFTPLTHPSLEKTGILKLLVELYSLNFEQINHLWSTLGGKYLPSVMYKVRHISLDEDIIVSEGGFIKEIRLDDKVKQPVTE
jgi:hypothetical protein